MRASTSMTPCYSHFPISRADDMENIGGTGSLIVQSQPHRRRYHSRNEASTALLLLMKFMPPSLLFIIALKYQGQPDVLFKKKPIPIWCFLGATFVYWLIEGAIKQDPTLDGVRLQITRNAAIASGVLSALSLLSIFLPHHLCSVPIIAWASMSVLLLMLPLRHRVYELVRDGIAMAADQLCAAVVWATGRKEDEEGGDGASLAV